MRIVDSLLIFCFFLSGLLSAYTQDSGIYLRGKKDPSKRLNNRWVFYPKAQPYIPISSVFKDIENENIPIEQDKGLIFGMVFEKFYPNGNLGYKFDLDYLSRDAIFSMGPRFYLSENYIGLTSILQFKKNKVFKEKIPTFEVGLKTQYTFSSVFVATDQNLAQEVDSYELLRNFRWYGYVGIGMENILSNVELGKSRYVGLKHFSIGVYFPLFNQANLFKNNEIGFEQPYDVFFKSRFSHLFFNINFAHALDLRRNLVSYTMPEEVYGDCGKGTLPFINWSNPKKNWFGNFYFHALLQPRIDSIFIDYSDNNRIITPISPASVSYRMGYTFHLLGNYRKHINTLTCLEYNESSADYKTLRFNFFLGAGISNRTFFVENGLSRVNLVDIEASGGARIGLHPFGLFLFGGYVYQFNLQKNLYFRNLNFEDFNFSNLENHYIFMGISFKNLISIRINYFKNLTNLKTNPRPLDKMSFSVGIGI